MRSCMLICLFWGLAQPGAALAEDPAAAAVIKKFVDCYKQAGGELTEADVTALEAGGGSLLGALEQAGGPCAGASGTCAEVLSNLSCEDFEEALTAAFAPSLPDGPAPAWAQTLAEAVTSKIVECYEAEQGAAATPDEKEKVSGFGDTMASALGLITSAGGCAVDASVLGTCTKALEAIPCAALGEALSTNPEEFVQSVFAEACAGVLDCTAALEAEAPFKTMD